MRRREKMGRRLHLVACLVIAAAAPAWAEGSAETDGPEGRTCSAILAAAGSIGSAPQYRSLLVATWPTRRRPVEREQIVVGDIIYANSAGSGRWMKLPMTAANREHLSAGLVRYPPHHCELSEQVVDGAPQKIYAYRQDVSGPDSATSQLWVGGQDGLPRRIESQEGTMRVVITLEYNDVKPPNIH